MLLLLHVPINIIIGKLSRGGRLAGPTLQAGSQSDLSCLSELLSPGNRSRIQIIGIKGI